MQGYIFIHVLLLAFASKTISRIVDYIPTPFLHAKFIFLGAFLDVSFIIIIINGGIPLNLLLIACILFSNFK